ncbi:hypothetical protein Bca4012_096894 [Brassica carinata]|uniref:Uncharacterized protein n=1 Tax=Brassica oleracea var. oleracea TaxID=109376 RepID=A0A0D3DXV8_BRAOL
MTLFCYHFLISREDVVPFLILRVCCCVKMFAGCRIIDHWKLWYTGNGNWIALSIYLSLWYC